MDKYGHFSKDLAPTISPVSSQFAIWMNVKNGQFNIHNKITQSIPISEFHLSMPTIDGFHVHFGHHFVGEQ
jgi:hypothetical protein